MSHTNLLAFAVLMASCTQNPALKVTRWSSESSYSRPLVTTEVGEFKMKSSFKLKNENIEMSSQSVSGYKIEGAFIKKITSSTVGVVFESSALIRNMPRFQLAKADKMSEKRILNWLDFSKKNEIYKTVKLISDGEVIFTTKPTLKPVLEFIIETSTGDLKSVRLDENNRLISADNVGSRLDDFVETSSLAFPKGPKKSELTAITLLRRIQAEGLSDSNIDILSQSTNKIVNATNLQFQITDDRFDDVQVFYFSHIFLNWFKKKLNTGLDFKLGFLTHMGYPEKTNAAFYFQNKVRLGSGDGITFANLSWDPSIVMHETAHAIIDSIAALPFQGEGGSLNEGFADTFATFYADSPLLGESSYLKGPYKRTVEMNLKMSEKNGGLYHDSAIVSGLFWALKKIIGTDKALDLALHVLVRLSPNSDFNDFKLCLKEQSESLLIADDLKKTKDLMTERELL